MALTRCKECKKEISTQAASCPNCGAKNESGISQFLKILILSIFSLGVFMSILNRSGKVSQPEPRPNPTNAEADTPHPAPKSPADIKKILKQFGKSVDKMEGFTTYYSHPQHGQTAKRVEVFMVEKGGEYHLAMTIMYEAEDWLFLKGVKFLIDDSPVELDFKYDEVKRDNTGESVWEWVNLPVDSDRLNLLDSISKGKKRQMRYYGRQYYKDRVIGDVERKSIQKMLDAFRAVGGKI